MDHFSLSDGRGTQHLAQGQSAPEAVLFARTLQKP